MSGHPIQNSELRGFFAPLATLRHVGLAVSGGCDSVALMHLIARWRELESPHLSVTVLSVDHALRPEAAAEAAQVGQWAGQLGFEAIVLRWEAEKPARDLQAAARQARYDLMATYAHAHGIDAILTAHHLDDQAETVLMRLARGSGVDGMAAIPVENFWAGIRILRPLLDVPKARLRATLEASGVSWLEDASNQSQRFERNRVRHAMRELKAFGIKPEALALTARRMRRARQALDAAATDFLSMHANALEAGFAHLPLPAMVGAPQEIALRVLARVIGSVGGQAKPIMLTRLEALASALRAGGWRARTLGGCRISLDGNRLTVARETGRAGLPRFELAPGEFSLWDRRFRVAASAEARGQVTVRALGRDGLAKLRAAGGSAMPPRDVVGGIVSFWRGNQLISVPPLDFWAEEPGRGMYAAAFLDPLCRGNEATYDEASTLWP